MKRKISLAVQAGMLREALSRHRRVLVLAGAGLLMVAAVFAWHASGPDQPEAGQPGVADGVRTLRLGLNIAADSALHAAAENFASKVTERSAGRLKVVVYPDQKLGNDEQMLEMARRGELDLLLTPTAKLSSSIPEMQYADLPFYFSGREELYAMLDGEPGQMLLSKMNRIGLVGLTFWENGFKQFTANTPLRLPRDFAGLRIRTMKSRLIIDQFESLGAKSIPIDFHATYKALAEGAVDGQENPLVAIVGMRFHEAQKHLTISNHAYLGYVFSASKRVFETLSPDMREIIQRSARELTAPEREDTARREATLIATIRAAGVGIHELTAAERMQFSRALAPIADKFGFEVGYDLLAKTEELRLARAAAIKSSSGSAVFHIGLDADLSGGGKQAGGAIFRGLQLALEDVNRKGGVLGRQLRLIALDHGGNPQIAQKNLESFATMPSLLAVVGGMQTSVISEELADIHRLGLPYLIPWAAGQELIAHNYQPSYTFRVSLNDREVAPFLLRRALKSGGPVAILLERSAWGRSNEAVLKPLIAKLPAGTAEIDFVYGGDPGLETRVKALLRDGKRAVLMVANAPVVGSIVEIMARQEKPVPIYSHWGLTGSDFWKQQQAALQRVDLRFVQSVLLDEPQAQPRLKAFAAHYRKRYGLLPADAIPSPVGSVQAYDLLQILARVASRAKSAGHADIVAALETSPAYSGVMGDYNPPFTSKRHEALVNHQLYMARFGERGRIVKAD